MDKIVFTVSKSDAGWFVFDGSAIGPFISKAHAVELAEGMAAAIVRSGQEAEVVVEKEPSVGSS